MQSDGDVKLHSSLITLTQAKHDLTVYVRRGLTRGYDATRHVKVALKTDESSNHESHVFTDRFNRAVLNESVVLYVFPFYERPAPYSGTLSVCTQQLVEHGTIQHKAKNKTRSNHVRMSRIIFEFTRIQRNGHVVRSFEFSDVPSIIPSYRGIRKMSNRRVFEQLNSSKYRKGQKKII